MNVTQASASQISTRVWSATPRSLTSYANLYTRTIVVQQTLVANGTFQLNSPASNIRSIAVYCISGATGGTEMYFNDGVTNFRVTTSLASAPSVFNFINVTSVGGVVIKNFDASNTTLYSYLAVDLMA